MAYSKMTFDGEYLNWYTIIVSNLTLPPTLSNYVPILNNVKTLELEGKYKNAICNSIKVLDGSCNGVYKEVNFNVQRVIKCVSSIYPKLDNLKNAIDEYNGYVDEYYRIKAEIEAEKKKKNGEKNGNN